MYNRQTESISRGSWLSEFAQNWLFWAESSGSSRTGLSLFFGAGKYPLFEGLCEIVQQFVCGIEQKIVHLPKRCKTHGTVMIFKGPEVLVQVGPQLARDHKDVKAKEQGDKNCVKAKILAPGVNNDDNDIL